MRHIVLHESKPQPRSLPEHAVTKGFEATAYPVLVSGDPHHTGAAHSSSQGMLAASTIAAWQRLHKAQLLGKNVPQSRNQLTTRPAGVHGPTQGLAGSCCLHAAQMYTPAAAASSSSNTIWQSLWPQRCHVHILPRPPALYTTPPLLIPPVRLLHRYPSSHQRTSSSGARPCWQHVSCWCRT